MKYKIKIDKDFRILAIAGVLTSLMFIIILIWSLWNKQWLMVGVETVSLFVTYKLTMQYNIEIKKIKNNK